jgi:hypothetical protein
MRFSTKVIILLFISLLALGCAAKNESKELFGYSFNVARPSPNQAYLDYDDGMETVQLKIISNVSQDVAERIIGDRIAMFQSIFQPKRVDYPGQYTKTIECPEQFKPKYFSVNGTDYQIKYFLGYANSNKVAGACSDDLIKYRHVYGFMYCSAPKKLAEIEYYSILSINKTDEFMKSLNCDIR